MPQCPTEPASVQFRPRAQRAPERSNTRRARVVFTLQGGPQANSETGTQNSQRALGQGMMIL
jgi:hypothetical protein